ncbi:MAG: phage terminase large subunit [Poseidonibacter sp.]
MIYNLKEKAWAIPSFPLPAEECRSYSNRILNYKKLTLSDKKILVNDFKEFYKYIFWNLGLPHPTLDQLFMAKYVSKLINTQDPLMLQAQRGLAKSLTVQILCAWMLLRNKNEVIVVISATSARAESFITFVKNLLINIPLLHHLAPRGSDRSSSRKIDVHGRMPNDSPSLSAFGVTSAKTGSRGSFLVYDDVEIPENSDSALKREKLLEGVRDAANLGIAGVFRELAICTPQSSESVYNTMLGDGFSRCIVPAEYPEDISVYEGDLAKHIERRLRVNPSLVGTATDKRNNEKHLIKQKLKGKSRYKLHYMLDTALSDAEKYPLKLSDLIVMDLSLEKAPTYIEYSSEKKDTIFDLKHNGFRGDYLYKPRYYDSTVRKEYEGIALFIDPSGRGSDETAWCVTAQLHGKIFLLGFGGVDGGYESKVLTDLSKIARDFKVNSVHVESNFGDGAFAELLKPYLRKIYPTDEKGQGVMVEDIRATSQKEARIIETLEPIMNQHRLVVNKSYLIKDNDKQKDYSFTYQLTHLTKDRGCLIHDDIIDVVGMGVQFWVESMAKDVDEEAKRHEEELKQKEIDEFMKDIDADFVKKRSNYLNRKPSKTKRN